MSKLKYFIYKISENKNLFPFSIVLFCFIYLLLCATPPFLVLKNIDSTVYWPYINFKVDNLLSPIDASPSSHEAKLNLRLTVPFILKLSTIQSSEYRFLFLMVIKWLLGAYFFYLLYRFAVTYFHSRSVQFLTVVSFVTIYVGKSFVNGIMWFDEFAFFFITMALFSRRWLIIFVSILLAVFVDERAFLSSLLVYVYKLYDVGSFTVRSLAHPLKQQNAILFAIAFALLIRIYLFHFHDLYVPVSEDGIIFFDYVRNGKIDLLIIGIFAAFKSLWFFIFLCLLFLYQQKKYIVAFLFCLSICLILVASMSVWDLTRSINFAFPSLIFAYRLIAESNQSSLWFKHIYTSLIGTAFLIPPIMVSDKIDIYYNIIIKIFLHKW